MGHEGVGPIEFENVPEAVFEPHREGLAVEVGCIIEQVDFNGRGGAIGIEGWPWPHMGHADPPSWSGLSRLSFRTDLNGIDSASRRQLMRTGRHEIGRAKPQGPAPGIAVDDPAGPFVGTAEEQAGTFTISVEQPLADLGAGHGELILDVSRDVYHVKSVGLAAGSKQVHIAFPTGTEPMVMPDHYRGGTQPVHEDVADEIRWLEPGEFPIEGLDDEVVESGSGEGGGPLVQGLEQLQSAIVSEKHLSRVRVKGEHHGLCGFLPGLSNHPVEECLMAEVHAVEGARGHDAPDALGEMGKTVVDVHCIQR